jgi:hypothetical protein
MGTYQLILEEGAVNYAREMLLELGEERPGKPSEKQRNQVATVEDLDRLKRISRKVLTAKSWDAFLRVR